MVARRRQLSASALVSAVLVAGGLAGCTVPGPAVPPGEPRAPAPGEPAPREVPMSAAADALLTQSRNERRTGDYARAAATLERALRIEPAAPAIWLELARLELAQGRYARAEQLARKAESLAVPGSAMAGECRTTVAEARRLAQGGG